ncbi:MAG: hypothetical protein ABI353_00980 [Isosphaeraceae bacterium]
MSRIRNPFFSTRPTDSRSKSRIRNARFAPEILDRKLSPSSIMPLDMATTNAEIYVMTDLDTNPALPPDTGTSPMTAPAPTPPPPDPDDYAMSNPDTDPDPTPVPDGDGEPPIVVTPPPTGPAGPAVVDASSDFWCP